MEWANAAERLAVWVLCGHFLLNLRVILLFGGCAAVFLVLKPCILKPKT